MNEIRGGLCQFELTEKLQSGQAAIDKEEHAGRQSAQGRYKYWLKNVHVNCRLVSGLWRWAEGAAERQEQIGG